MKKILEYMLAGAAVLSLAACEKDGEKLIVSNPGAPGEFTVSATDIRLTSDKAGALALTLVWTEGTAATLSNPTVAMQDGIVSQSVQFSAEKDFAEYTKISVDSDKTSLQLTGNDLSNILIRLNLTEVQTYDIYARVALTLGKTSVYSDAVSFTVTPYSVETGIMKMVDKNNKENVLTTLRCKDETPELFEGFAVTPSTWYNVLFFAADGIQWGCDSGWTAFSLIPNSTNNCWFSEPAGCQYVFADTKNQLWWHIYLPSVNATAGEAVTELKWSNAAGAFSGTVTTTSDNTVLTIGGTGKRYDSTTGASSASVGTDYAFSFVPSADGTFEFAEGSDASASVSVGTAGTYTLTFKVSDCTWTLTEGESGGDGDGDGDGDDDDDGDDDSWPEDPDYVAATSELLYIYGIDNDTKNPTDIKGKLLLSDGIYTGYYYFSGWEKFVFGDGSVASSAKVYGSAPLSDNAGLYRLFCGSSRWDIWFPSGDPAYTRVSVNMAERSWKYETVNKISIAENFNGWKLDTDPMTFDSESKTWSATITVEDWGEFGIQFIVNDDWTWSFSDEDKDGVLDTGTSAFKPDLVPGTYKITIDLNDPQNMTVNFE